MRMLLYKSNVTQSLVCRSIEFLQLIAAFKTGVASADWDNLLIYFGRTRDISISFGR